MILAELVASITGLESYRNDSTCIEPVEQVVRSDEIHQSTQLFFAHLQSVLSETTHTVTPVN